MCSNSLNTDGVILLVYGIPAAGKTRLSTSLCKESVAHNDGSFVSVHFDDFYPPDLRTAAQEDTCTHNKSDDTCVPLFKLKYIRKEINDNLEHLIRINELGTAESDSPAANKGESWSKFLCQISSSNPHAIFDDHGRYVRVYNYAYFSCNKLMYTCPVSTSHPFTPLCCIVLYCN